MDKPYRYPDLGFPYHQPETGAERLASIQRYMESHGIREEYYLDGSQVTKLENQLCEMFGMPAAMWAPSGTLAQGIAARIYRDQSPHNSILLHPTSHLLLHEESGYQYAHGLTSIEIGQWDSLVSESDLHGHAACAIIELPQRHHGGLLPSWQNLEEIKRKASELRLPLHMDGARLWATRRYYGGRSYAAIVNGFSSVYVSLYKDIGAMGGAVLLGNQPFIDKAKIWRVRLGGLLPNAWPLVVDALRLIDLRVKQMPEFVAKARSLAKALEENTSVKVTPFLPHVNMFHLPLMCTVEEAQRIHTNIAETTGISLGNRFWSLNRSSDCALEITVGEKVMSISDDLIVRALSMLVAESGRGLNLS